MKTLHYLILTLLAFSTLSSCKQSKDDKLLMPNVTGRAGEVVLVIEDELYKTEIGEGFKNLLRREVPALPQREPYFNLVNIPSSAFSKIFRTHRNLIYTKVSSDVQHEAMIAAKDRWAQPQIYIQLEARTKETLLKLIEKNGQQISDLIEDAERERLITRYKKYQDLGIERKLRKEHGVSLAIPKGYSLDMDSTNFVWLTYQPSNVWQGIFLYYTPYTDTAQFNTNNIIANRNRALFNKVTGSPKNSYMTTDMQYPAQRKVIELNGKYAVKTNGLWYMENDTFGGGPFVSLTTVDEKNNRLVTVEGYVHAPKFNKRNYLRQVEAICYTMVFKD